MNILQRPETLELVSYVKLCLHNHFVKCIFVSHHAKEAEIFFKDYNVVFFTESFTCDAH